MVNVHFFYSSGDAYDATQCNEEIKNGDVFVIPSEKVIGVADTWPIAVTKEYGKFHTFEEGSNFDNYKEGKLLDGAYKAMEILYMLGWEG